MRGYMDISRADLAIAALRSCENDRDAKLSLIARPTKKVAKELLMIQRSSRSFMDTTNGRFH